MCCVTVDGRTGTILIGTVRANIVANGAIVEDYPDDVRGLSALVLSFLRDSSPV